MGKTYSAVGLSHEIYDFLVQCKTEKSLIDKIFGKYNAKDVLVEDGARPFPDVSPKGSPWSTRPGKE